MKSSVRLPDGTTLTVQDDTPKEKRGKAEPFAAAAASTYVRTCYVTLRHNLGQWQLTQYATFYYDYSSVWQASPPPPATRANWPYSWSNLHSWNTPWDITTAFTDGQGLIKFGSGISTSQTWRVYIGQDAWGNCWVGAYRP